MRHINSLVPSFVLPEYDFALDQKWHLTELYYNYNDNLFRFILPELVSFENEPSVLGSFSKDTLYQFLFG